MKPSWLLLFLPGALLGAPACHGAPPTPQPAAITEKDVLGDWCLGTWSDNEWVITIYPNHTLNVVLDGYAASRPVTTSWRLAHRRLLVDAAPLIKQFGPGPKDQPFGQPFTVSRYRNNALLLPEANARLIRAHGPEPAFCFWHYTVDKQKGTQLPPEAAALIKRERR